MVGKSGRGAYFREISHIGLLGGGNFWVDEKIMKRYFFLLVRKFSLTSTLFREKIMKMHFDFFFIFALTKIFFDKHTVS